MQLVKPFKQFNKSTGPAESNRRCLLTAQFARPNLTTTSSSALPLSLSLSIILLFSTTHPATCRLSGPKHRDAICVSQPPSTCMGPGCFGRHVSLSPLALIIPESKASWESLTNTLSVWRGSCRTGLSSPASAPAANAAAGSVMVRR